MNLLRILLIAVVLAWGWLTVTLLAPQVRTATATAPPVDKIELPNVDLDGWRSLAVQDSRLRPLECAAVDSVRQIVGRESFQGHEATAIVLSWWLDGRSDRWENVPFILCDHRGLREAIDPSLPLGARISPHDLRRSEAFDRLVEKTAKARKQAGAKAHLVLSTEELKAEEVAGRLLLYDMIRGLEFCKLHTNVLSKEKFWDVREWLGDGTMTREQLLEHWSTLSLLRGPPAKGPQPWNLVDDENAAGISWDHLEEAYRSGQKERMAEAASQFFDRVRNIVVDRGIIDLELRYLHWKPFRWGLVSMFLALVACSFAWASGSRWFDFTGFALFVISLAFQGLGFTWRTILAGRAPVSNMYETVIFVAFASALLAFALELIYRRRIFAVAGAMVSTLGLLLADQLPMALDPKIGPLVPILQSNYWLTVHVLTIVCSYAAGTLAWGLGNLSLGIVAFSKPEPGTLKMLSGFTYRAMQVAVVLLAAGTLLGGWWASESWGRFWGWDPKEVGALIALICYVLPLHARFIGWVGDLGLAVSAVLCYGSIVLSWYVINFVFAVGLHSYGFSAGGGAWVLWATLLNLAWVLWTLLRVRAKTNLFKVFHEPRPSGSETE